MAADLRAQQIKFRVDRLKTARNLIASARSPSASDSEIQKLVQEEIQRRQDIQAKMAGQSEKGDRIFVKSAGKNQYAPADEILHSFIDGIDLTILASMEPGQRNVYSSNPNRMQSRHPVSLTNAVNSFIAEHNRIVDIAARSPRPSSDITFRGGLDLNANKINSVAKLLITVKRMEDIEAYILETILLDSKGNSIATAQLSIYQTPAIVTPENPPAGIVTWTPESNAFLEIFNWRSSQKPKGFDVNVMMINEERVTLTSDMFRPQENLRPVLKAAILDVNKRDPLSFFVAESIQAIAQSKNLNLVATAPDSVFYTLGSIATQGQSKQADCLRGLASDCAFSESDGFLTVSPQDRPSAEQSRVNRSNLGAFLTSLDKIGFMALEPKLAYLNGTNHAPSANRLDMIYSGLINPSETDNLLGNITNSYRLGKVIYPMLPQFFRMGVDVLTIPYAQLSPAQRNELHAEIFSRGGSFILGEGTMIMVESGNPSGPEPVDITEEFPNGIPASAFLRIQPSVNDVVFARFAGVNARWVLGPAALGSMALLRSDPAFLGSGFQPPDFHDYIPGISRGYRCSLQLNQDSLTESDFTDYQIDTKNRAVDFASLPKNFQDRVKAAQNQFRGSFPSGGGGGGKPPIPPRSSLR